MPSKKPPKADKHQLNPYTRFFDAQKSLPQDKGDTNGQKPGDVYNRESVYVLSNKARSKRRFPIRENNQPTWRRRGGGGGVGNEDHIMVVTQDSTQQPRDKPVYTASQLDAICYDVIKEPPMQFHVDGTDIVPSIRGLRLSVCVEHTRFQLVGKVTRNMGFQHVPEHRLWNIQWSDSTPHHDLLRNMKRFQQINHFPGMVEICRKDLLSRNLNRMLKLFPGDYRIFPKTWLMPTDAYDVAIYASKHKRTFILKPYSAGQGRGIWITTDLRTVGKREKLICQTYIERPLLIDGYKFDLRVYTLVTSVDPLRIFVYNEGLARFATQKYVPPTMGNSHNVFMHLTNYCLNRRNSQYMVGNGPEAGSKRKLSAFNKWLVDHNYDVAEFWASVDDAIIKTLISAWPTLKHNYNVCFPKHDKIQASFQLLGFDILVDWKLKPYILEVNHTPSLSADESVDMEVKRPLIRDTLNMLSTALVDKEQIIRDDRTEHRARLLRNIYNKKAAAQMPGYSSPTREVGGTDVRQACSIGALTQQIAWEESHLGNYRRIMPPRDSEKVNYYCKFYEQNKQPMFADTVASRRREELNHQAMQKHQRERLQDQFLQQQLLAQAQNRMGKHARWPDDQLQVNPVVQQSKRRREEAEAQAKKHRAVIAREIQRQKEQLLAPTCAKERLGIWQSVRREKRHKFSPKRSSSITKANRRKQQRNLSQRARHQRMLEMEAQRDAKFLEQHAKKQRLEGGRVMGRSESPGTKSKGSIKSKGSFKKRSKGKPFLKKRIVRESNQSLEKKSREELASRSKTQHSIHWTAGIISKMENDRHLSWRKERTDELNNTRLRELIFSKMYENGHLTKNDIKCFPDLLYRILSKDFTEASSQ
ncbi:tubulin polyglutamylase ttll6 [Drosophila biarmipes]|uniref:tubulin polyglutamylase ttll6 n=1 Tax=Drosophila biarmipes TaxID=125945 RepID=UPI0007E71A83|nr:tubulin polyglutamylase ttll6 [Drosophila biarmipes]